MSRSTVAVMQPYFFPYPAYYRLLMKSDVFVILDSVQFPRRGRVHRCEITKVNDEVDWLTLPLVKSKVDTQISDIELADGWVAEVRSRLRKFPLTFEMILSNEQVYNSIFSVMDDNLSLLLEDQIKCISSLLDLKVDIVKASSLDLDQGKVGEDRIIEIVRAVNGDKYINSPGGRKLYDAEVFREFGIELSFLPETKLGTTSILEHIHLLENYELRRLMDHDSK